MPDKSLNCGANVRRCTGALIPIALVAASGLAVAGPVAGPDKIGGADGPRVAQSKARELRLMPSKGATETLQIDDLDAASSRATPLAYLSPTLRLTGQEPTHVRVLSSLIVSATNKVTLIEALGDAGAIRGQGWAKKNIRPIAGFDDMWVVDVSTVRDALNLGDALAGDDRIISVEVQKFVPRTSFSPPSDPLVSSQWHIKNLAPFPPAFADLDGDGTFEAAPQDHGIDAVYTMGYTGAGVTMGVLETSGKAFDRTHPDLVNKVVEPLNMAQNDFLSTMFFGHGTSVAGLMGAEANNGLGGTGIAYDAKLVALRNDDGIFGGADSLTEAFIWRDDQIDLKNHSWGFIAFPIGSVGTPGFGSLEFGAYDAGGLTGAFSAPGRALRQSSKVNGQIHVWAAGNSSIWTPVDFWLNMNALEIDGEGNQTPGTFDGAAFSEKAWLGVGDRTEYSSTAQYRDVLAIGAVGENNLIAGYSTTGTNVIAAGYSEGYSNEKAWAADSDGAGKTILEGRGITTAEVEDGFDNDTMNPATPGSDADIYTSGFNGTSAAAPITSGIIGLMLEANPDLTVRDIKHIFQATADPFRIPTFRRDISGVTDYVGSPAIFGGVEPSMWQMNKAFVAHSDAYGFGVIDAEAAVTMAETFEGAPSLTILDTQEIVLEEPIELPGPEWVQIDDTIAELIGTAPPSTIDICVRPNIQIEDVELTITVSGRGAGDVLLQLRSAGGSWSGFSYPRLDGREIVVDGTGYAYYKYTFNSLKHWDELSGGIWRIVIADLAPEDSDPGVTGDDEEGVLAYAYLPTVYTLPIDDFTEEHTVVDYRLRVFGTETGLPAFQFCNLLGTICPGDINGDGIVDPKDIIFFLDLWEKNSVLADVNGDGFVDFSDVLAFYRAWVAGPCGQTEEIIPGGGGRPVDDEDIIIIG